MLGHVTSLPMVLSMPHHSTSTLTNKILVYILSTLVSSGMMRGLWVFCGGWVGVKPISLERERLLNYQQDLIQYGHQINGGKIMKSRGEDYNK